METPAVGGVALFRLASVPPQFEPWASLSMGRSFWVVCMQHAGNNEVCRCFGIRPANFLLGHECRPESEPLGFAQLITLRASLMSRTKSGTLSTHPSSELCFKVWIDEFTLDRYS
jgi:hypothetical protein